MPNIPNTSQPGQSLFSAGNGTNASYWGDANSGVIVLTKSYAILGPLVAYTFPGFTMAVPTGQVVGLIAVVTQLSAGTGTVEITQNGSGITGLTALSVTTPSSGYVTPTTNPTSVADLDRFSFVLSSPSGTGDIVIDYVFSVTP
jgi:hypothetical protein